LSEGRQKKKGTKNVECVGGPRKGAGMTREKKNGEAGKNRLSDRNRKKKGKIRKRKKGGSISIVSTEKK